MDEQPPYAIDTIIENIVTTDATARGTFESQLRTQADRQVKPLSREQLAFLQQNYYPDHTPQQIGELYVRQMQEEYYRYYYYLAQYAASATPMRSSYDRAIHKLKMYKQSKREEDMNGAVVLLRHADPGVPSATYALLLLHDAGIVKNDKEHIELLQKAASWGHEHAHKRLITIARQHLAGGDKNFAERILTHLAALNVADAQYNLGMAYILGTRGIQKDMAKGTHLLCQAGGQGHIEAQKKCDFWQRVSDAESLIQFQTNAAGWLETPEPDEAAELLLQVQDKARAEAAALVLAELMRQHAT